MANRRNNAAEGRIVAYATGMQLCAYVGLAAFAVAWIPQSLDTIKAGRCDVNGLFLVLSMIGSLALMLYALLRGDAVFSAVNALTTVGALVNIYYRRFPRVPRGA
ncbi:MAG: lipid-A-disaccharide synthase N-terminal domain-containing protein [Elusimicrobiota bacterium]